MGSKYCMPRNVLYVIFILQLISTAERQIFDFLGYMWLPILANFFNIIFVIFGIFGLYQYRANYLIAYTVWSFLWIGFNVFIICYYLSIGDLNAREDLLSFGTGSFSWWVVNTPGCQPHYNTTVSPGYNPLHPLRPSYVEGCVMNYENVEVTHAGIQVVLSCVGLSLASYMIHFVIKVVNPKREKQGLKAMYSIEYSSTRAGDTSNPNTLERETDLHEMEAGAEARAHMTPRRVKRRSYRNSSRSSKSLSRQQRDRASGHHKSARSSARSHKSINPVTRLIDADQNRADSSTSNDYNTDLPSYGQINPGFTGDQSRPNSIYNLSLNPPTDIEASRPQSTLTSYSNFHHQRRPAVSNVPSGGGGPQQNRQQTGVTNLTQESLMNHDSGDMQQPPAPAAMNCSYDDLPPPPPPLSSSPSPPGQEPGVTEASDSDNNSSVVTAAMPPVPQLRSSIRRNEYVNIPVTQKEPEAAIISHQEPEPQQPGPRTSSLPGHQGGHQGGHPGGHPGGNYVNYPQNSVSPQPQYNGARPRTTNPLYKPQQQEAVNSGGNKTYINDYTAVERRDPMPRPESTIVPEYETRISYEAETLRADTKMTMPPPYYNDPVYSLSSDDPSSQRSSQAEPHPPPPPRGYLPVPSRESDGDARYFPETKGPASHSLSQANGYHHQNDSTAVKPRTGFPAPHTNEQHDSGLGHSMGSEFNGHPEPRSGPASMPAQPSEAAMRRIPSGGRSRDRASLRARQRRDMEAKAGKQQNMYVNTTQAQNGSGPPGGKHHQMSPPVTNGRANGYADMSGMRSPGPEERPEDKWYMKDSMRPVGAVAHGQACKCYRCQRKLTAI